MAKKCEVAGCAYYAVEGETKCLQHKPKKIPTPVPASAMASPSPSAGADGFTWVPVAEIPANARYNEEAAKLFAAMKLAAASNGHALKVSMKVYKKVALLTAQRYARASGLRIGVRIVGETGYLWKLSEAEIKKVEQKGERLRKVREKKR